MIVNNHQHNAPYPPNYFFIAMTKVANFILGLATLVVFPAAGFAQETSTSIAVNQAVLRQANKIVLGERLAEARAVEQRGDTAAAAKIYQECADLAAQIGPAIEAETAQALNGLANTRLALARAAQARGDYREAGTQVQQVLKADPKNATALAFKKKNDQILNSLKGQIPSPAAQEQVQQESAKRVDAGTLVQDGKLFYEMGKLDEAETKLKEAQILDPDNRGAFYYMNLIQQAKIARESTKHNQDTQTRMAEVEKRWVMPTSKVVLKDGNPYATNPLVYTGPGRQSIIAKLDRVRLDNVSYDGLPLSEVLRNLSEQSRLRDPERKGVNFLINPNPDLSGRVVAATTGGAGGYGEMGFAAPAAAPAIDPATGLPFAAAPAPAAAEQVDVGSFIVKIPSLTDVRLAEVLDAIVLVCDHPVKYSIQDFAVVFSSKGAESPQLFSRTFKVDPNTFYSGLEAVSAQNFGSTGGSSGGGGGGGRGGGGGGGGGGGNNNNDNGAVVGVVNAFPGAGGFRSSGNSGGGGGGGGGQSTGTEANLGGGVGSTGASATSSGGGGLRYVTKVLPASEVSAAARAFFTTLGVNLENPPGKSVFFNDKLGKLFVKATEQDLDTIERAIEALNEVAPQVHIKSRFIEVQQNDSKALGFDWYLGQFNVSGGGSVVASGGSSGSLTTPVSAANPLGAFPGSTTAGLISGGTSDQLLTGGLRNSAPALGTITGILTDPNFRFVIHALEQRSGVEFLAEPEVTTTSGRQTQMRATSIISVVTDVDFEEGSAASVGNNNTGQ
jgi:tetratricopeptide (TPR) repeat protein